MDKFLTKNQRSIFILLDVLFIIVSYMASAMFLDMFGLLNGTYYFVVAIAFTCAFHCISFECFKLYNIIWLYAGINDYEHYINPYISCKSSLYVACSRPLETLKVLHKTPLLDTFPQSSSDIWGNSKTGKQINPFDGDLPF